MAPPKKYIIFGNADYKGWVWLADFDAKIDAHRYIKSYLKDVPWQWTLTKVLVLKGYE